MADFIGYDEALRRIELYMEESGIRRFCTVVCKGHCCRNCYGSSKDCQHNEGRRISCSAFVCPGIKRMIKYCKDDYNALLKLKGAVEMAIADVRKNTPATNKNPYFEPMSSEEMKVFKLTVEALDNLPSPSRSRKLLDRISCFFENDIVPFWDRKNQLI